ncbi:MAG: peptide MFS transporter [bacterium]|jgi:POT family proton-dependent oligopeptide transporter|nr:MAG: MFS transporter [bacterium]
MARETSSGIGAATAAPSEAAAPGLPGATFLGHPRGLSTLFFTEMWERFSYYGMRALLILFMTAAATGANPGLGFGEATAGAVYGLYTSMVYLLALPGGWIADNLWGQRKAVFVGGCIIALGHFTLAAPLVGLPEVPSFFLGLLFVAVGTGLLKPNVSTMVGDLYPEPGPGATEHERQQWAARRDAAFSVFYMGINIGAMLGPFICSTLGEGVDWGWLSFEGSWHWGFSAAGFGMVLGLIQYRLGDRYLGRAGHLKTNDPEEVLRRRSRNFYTATAVVAAVAALTVYLLASGTLGMTLSDFATWVGYGILLLSILFFAYLIFNRVVAAALLALFAVLVAALAPGMGTEGGQWAIIVTLGAFVVLNLGLLVARGASVSVEKKRLMVIFWLFLLAAIFWSGFEQAGSSMNLFAQDLTDRRIFGREIPAGYLQNVNPFFIIVLAPVFGTLWTWLARRDRNPSIPVKFALGLLGLAAGMFVLAWGASYASATNRVSMAWLVVTYFLFTVGELALSPVGLSSMTKLAPPGRMGQMMGMWFIAAALGNLFAGLVAGSLETMTPTELFRSVAIFAGGVGILALVLSPGVKRLMGGVQ